MKKTVLFITGFVLILVSCAFVQIYHFPSPKGLTGIPLGVIGGIMVLHSLYGALKRN